MPDETAITDLSFEDALSALEDVVRKLEGQQVPLEQSIDLYERGEALRKHCEARLKAAEMRVEKITASSDGAATGAEPFEP